MRNFTLAEEFTDAGAERGFLAALVSQPTLKSRFADALTLALFPAEQKAAETLLSGDPAPAILAWQATADPDKTYELLQDLHRRRLLANLQEKLGDLLYNPAAKIDDAAGLMDRWRMHHGATVPVEAPRSMPTSSLLDQVLENAVMRFTERAANGGVSVTGIPTGLTKLDNLLNGLGTGLHVLGGAPGAGKTTLALQIAVSAASGGWPVLYLTFENTPSNLILKAVCAEAGQSPLDAERGFADVGKLKAAAEKLRPSLERLTVVEGTLRLTSAGIRRAAEECFSQGKPGLVVVDYLQRAAHQHGYDQLRHNVSRLAAELREMASVLRSPVLALASQNRSAGDYGKGGGSAQLDSLKESGDLEYAADSVFFLRADKKRSLAEPVRAIEIAVVKNRFGPLGAIPLVYRADTGYIREDTQEPAHAISWTGEGFK